MNRRNKIFFAGILLLFSGLVVIRHFVPRPVDWNMSFNGNRRSPYACSVTREMLPALFPGKEITVNTASLFITLPRDTAENKNLIIISDNLNADEYDIYSLLDFVARGNTVFISTLGFPEKLCDTLNLETRIPFADTSFFKTVKESLRLSFTGTLTDSVFHFSKKMPENRFMSYDTLRSVALGSDRSGNTNFIMTSFGKGRIYLHCQPLAFTNFHLLYGDHRYACTALSHLPVINTIWDQYYKPDNYYDLSPVRYILSQPALRSAYYLLFILLLTYMIFGAKRMQRPLPVIQPEVNSSLEFITTVGKLYYRSQNHTDLARKKLIYFREFIRNRYYMHKSDRDDDQVRALSLRSGVDENKVRSLMHMVHIVSDRKHLGVIELIEFHKTLEDFYKNCK